MVVVDAPGQIAYRTVAPEDALAESSRIDDAVSVSLEELRELRRRTADSGSEAAARIFDFHMELLQDAALINQIRADIAREHVVAEYAASEALNKLADTFRAMDSEVFQQKAADVVDLERRLLARLVGTREDISERLRAKSGDVIVVAHVLTPSDASELHRLGVAGFATDGGGLTGHTSILARALGMPAVVGATEATDTVADGDTVIVDGDAGTLIVRPDTATLAQYHARREERNARSRALRSMAGVASDTIDGTHIRLLGNIEFPDEIESVLSNGGEGVGLYRTEYLHMTSASVPTEEEHYQAYVRAITLLGGRALTIRTLDLGADKYTQEHLAEPERNPFLGLRSIRYCLHHPEIFKRQLRAILRASAHGTIRIMFPLVSNVTELRQARIMVRDLCEELDEEGIAFDRNISIGMMIEVPSAALMARVFAAEADFFSIGTNDLIQYTLAVDRGNERVANLYTGSDPEVLSLEKSVIRADRHAGSDTSICGEIAGDPLFTMLLIGLGLRTLSMSPGQIPLVKRVVRAMDIPRCELLARRVGSFDTERQVKSYLRDELRRIDPEALIGM